MSEQLKAQAHLTIIDTNDIESIIIEYARNQSTSNPPDATTGGWSTTRPAWAQGYYIWQRARIHKSGTDASTDTFGTAVCITGSTGQTGGQGPQGETGAAGRSLTATETKYTSVASGTTKAQVQALAESNWSSNVPSYNSAKPDYWVRIINTYDQAPLNETIYYKDNGTGDAIATAAAANTTATQAASDASSAKTTAETTQTNLNNYISSNNANITALQSRLKKIWTNLNNSASYPAGTYAASGIGNADVVENDSSTYGYNTFLTQNKLALRYNAIDMTTLTTNALTFYIPTQDNNNNWIQGPIGMSLTASGIELFKTDGQATPSAISVANFGEDVRIGSQTSGHVSLTSSGIEFYGADGARQGFISSNSVKEISQYINRTWSVPAGTGVITLDPPVMTSNIGISIYISGRAPGDTTVSGVIHNIGETITGTIRTGVTVSVTLTDVSTLTYNVSDSVKIHIIYTGEAFSTISAFGIGSDAKGANSFAAGFHAQTEQLINSMMFYTGNGAAAFGVYNQPTWHDYGYDYEVPYLFTIGNGTDDNNRSNAFAIKNSGVAIFGAGGSFNGYLSARGVDIDNGESYCIDGVPLSASDVNAVPTSRKVNNKALSSDISLTASDVNAVPTTRTVNSKALSSDISLTASDVSAIPTSDKQSYSSASSLSWNSLSTEQKAMVPTIQGLAFWNGAYDGSSSNLKYSANGSIIGTGNLSSSGNNHTYSISANSVKSLSFTITRAGYYPVCIDRINLGGTGSDKICLNKYGITARSSGSVTYEVAYYNPTATAYTNITVAVYVLWARI